MTNQYDVYDAEAELLDIAAQAAINEQPFYLQKELNDLTDQVRLLDHITDEAQADYFIGEISHILDRSEKMTVIVNPALNSGVRYAHSATERTAAIEFDGCGNDSDLYDYARGG